MEYKAPMPTYVLTLRSLTLSFLKQRRERRDALNTAIEEKLKSRFTDEYIIRFLNTHCKVNKFYDWSNKENGAK